MTYRQHPHLHLGQVLEFVAGVFFSTRNDLQTNKIMSHRKVADEEWLSRSQDTPRQKKKRQDKLDWVVVDAE